VKRTTRPPRHTNRQASINNTYNPAAAAAAIRQATAAAAAAAAAVPPVPPPASSAATFADAIAGDSGAWLDAVSLGTLLQHDVSFDRRPAKPVEAAYLAHSLLAWQAVATHGTELAAGRNDDEV